MTVVVSDTSPIRALQHLDLLSLLPAQFGRIIVPAAVMHELENPLPVFPRVDPGVIPIAEILAPSDHSLLSSLSSRLDAGEAVAIALALETPAAKLLIDEALGRKIAEDHGLEAFGTVRVLLDAKKLGLIPEVAPLVERLIQELSFFLSPAVVARVRRLAGE